MSHNFKDNAYISAFCLEMSLLLHAGIGLEDGLYLLMEDEPKKANVKILNDMAKCLSQGNTLSDSMKFVGEFPEYVCDMIDTGERTGRLEQTFKALSDYYDRQDRLTKRVKSAIMYPMLLLVLMLAIIIVLMVQVLPVFNKVYEQLGGTMTGTAKNLLEIGQLLGSAVPVLLAILGVIVVLTLIASASGSIRRILTRLVKKIGGDRGIFRKIGEARFASAMAMGLLSGLNTEESFSMAMVFNSDIKKAKKRYENCLKMLENGNPLSTCFKKNKIFSASYCRILDLSAKSGATDTAMDEIARRSDENVQNSIERLVGKIEPTIVVITSLLVGIILIVVMLPLINIMSSIG